MGEPSIATAISTVHHGRLIYRGQDAVDLAAEATLEDVARLLWQHPREIAFRSEIARARRDPFVALAGLVADGRHLLGRLPEQLSGDAASVVGTLAAAIGARTGSGPVTSCWRAAGASAPRAPG